MSLGACPNLLWRHRWPTELAVVRARIRQIAALVETVQYIGPAQRVPFHPEVDLHEQQIVNANAAVAAGCRVVLHTTYLPFFNMRSLLRQVCTAIQLFE